MLHNLILSAAAYGAVASIQPEQTAVGMLLREIRSLKNILAVQAMYTNSNQLHFISNVHLFFLHLRFLRKEGSDRTLKL